MLIKELEIENIRSYTKAKINFPSGITLFEGDIGSGKSTILYGIEFALFGSSDIPPSFLLRNGKNRGEVKLTFDVDGKEYKIHRALIRKNGSISQTGCWIETSGLRTEYSPTEMRKEVLNILQFNEPPNVRSSSVIYRYAVFTPQEEMKEILTKNEEERLQTLRKALRIEEYKIAKDNTAFLVREIGKKCEYLKGECMDLEARKREMEKKREAYEKGILEINVSKENVKKLKAEVEELGKRKEEGELHINLLRNLEEKKKILEIELEKANEKFVEINAELENIKIYEDRIKEIETKVFELKNMKANRDSMEIEYRKKMKLMGEIGVLEEKMNVLNERKKKIDKRKRDMDVMLAQREKIGHIDELLGNEREKLNKIMDERTKILMELKNIGIELRKLEKEKNEYSTFVEGSACPKCGQLLSREHINKIFREIEKNYDELIKNKDLLEIRREEKIKEMEDLAFSVKEMEKKWEVAMKLGEKIEQINREIMESGLEEIENIKDELLLLKEEEKSYEVDEELLEKIKSEIEKGKSLEEEYMSLIAKIGRKEELKKMQERNLKLKNENECKREETIKKLSDLQKKWDEKSVEEIREKYYSKWNKLTEERTRLQKGEVRISEIKEDLDIITNEVRTKEKKKEEHRKLKEIENVLSLQFLSALDEIEKTVLANVNEEFNSLFQKWFGMMVENMDLTVSIDENFTPRIENEGYELNFASLSGGEKTSVAIAYRLSLNTMVKKCSKAMKTNLIILDEPTDGFSKEQLYRMRDILNELACNQVILVSHEKELESFADNVFKVIKSENISRVIQS